MRKNCSFLSHQTRRESEACAAEGAQLGHNNVGATKHRASRQASSNDELNNVLNLVILSTALSYTMLFAQYEQHKETTTTTATTTQDHVSCKLSFKPDETFN